MSTPDTKGYVYVLSNPSMPGLLKIGRSGRSGSERARELSRSSGIPAPFKLEFELLVDDSQKTEKAVHFALRKSRVNCDREFFEIDLESAKEAIENPDNLEFIGLRADQDTDDHYDQEIISLRREVVLYRSKAQAAVIALGVSKQEEFEIPKLDALDWSFMAEMFNHYGAAIKQGSLAEITFKTENAYSCFINCAYMGYFDTVDVSTDDFMFELGERSTKILLANNVISHSQDWESAE